MKSLNRKLFKILSTYGLSLGMAGMAIAFLFPPPRITVLIERSYCPPEQWQQLVQSYTDLYQKQQNRELQIKAVVLFSDLGQEVLASVPNPETLRSLNTYGRSNPQKQHQLSATYPHAKILSCQAP